MDWIEFDLEMGELAKRIGYRPEIIVGVVRGGIVPSRILSKRLGVREIYCINVRKVGEERKVTTEILDDLTGKNILLVEDMLETGKSLIVAKQYLESKGAKVKTACLHIMPKSEIKPDFYLKQVETASRFPWE